MEMESNAERELEMETDTEIETEKKPDAETERCARDCSAFSQWGVTIGG